MHIGQAKLGQADAGENEAKLMTKPAPEWVRTSDPVIRSPARYRWTTAPACPTLGGWTGKDGSPSPTLGTIIKILW